MKKVCTLARIEDPIEVEAFHYHRLVRTPINLNFFDQFIIEEGVGKFDNIDASIAIVIIIC